MEPIGSQFDSVKIFNPASYTITEDNTAWRLIVTPKPAVLVATDPATIIRFRPYNPGGTTGAAYGQSRQGIAPLMAAGHWYVQLPVVGASAVARTLFLLDYAMYAGAFEALVVNPATGYTPGAATKVTVANGVSTSLVAASATRTRVSFTNPPAGVDVWLAFGAEAAVVGEGIGLFPGEMLQIDPADGFASSAINAIADGAAQDIGVQVWT